jgi:hypothetical protein
LQLHERAVCDRRFQSSVPQVWARIPVAAVIGPVIVGCKHY